MLYKESLSGLFVLPLCPSLRMNAGSHQPPLTSERPLMAGTSCGAVLNFLSSSADPWLEGSHWPSSPGRRGLLSRRPVSSMQTFSFFTSSRAESGSTAANQQSGPTKPQPIKRLEEMTQPLHYLYLYIIYMFVSFDVCPFSAWEHGHG